ncbi:hypothetical protein SKAU_G00031320 [Synaphobranchus kaupii]|uniref:Uncharacterized protein n=1 Tax=Synaphobranchus kaupii TaxID=118154 RepID=A0A9Q1GDW3_SYNKA|nr:hypothetical protein SKAU_G00031320 [Synaphobranchus kaupii]
MCCAVFVPYTVQDMDMVYLPARDEGERAGYTAENAAIINESWTGYEQIPSDRNIRLAHGFAGASERCGKARGKTPRPRVQI